MCLVSVTQPIFSHFFSNFDMIKISKFYLESSEVKKVILMEKSRLLVFKNIFCWLTC